MQILIRRINEKGIVVNINHDYIRKVSSIMFEIKRVFNLSDKDVRQLTGFSKNQIDDSAWLLREVMNSYDIDL